MAVGKESILRAGSANAAAKEKKNGPAEGKEQEKTEIKKDKTKAAEERKNNKPAEPVMKVQAGELRSVPKTWGTPVLKKEDVAALAVSIKEFGMIVPVLVYKNKKQELLILKGYHRMAAARKAGLTEIPVCFTEAGTDSKAKKLFEELRSLESDKRVETASESKKDYEIISSISASLPAYLL